MKRSRPIDAKTRAGTRRTARVAGPRAAWKPLSLVWRKPRRFFPLAVAPTPAIGVHQFCSPRFHLHFNFAISRSRLERHIAAPALSVTTIIWRRLDARLTSMLPVVRALSSTEWRSTAHRIQCERVTQQRTIRESAFTEVKRTYRNARLAARAADGALPFRLANSTVLVSRARTPASARHIRNPATAPFGLELKAAHPRQHNPTPLPASVRIAGASSAPFRSPELVWRADAEARTIEAVERHMNAAAAFAPTPPAAPTLASQHAPAAVETLQPRALDPALIDRVAEDVIGRVERRIRIERERRGV